MMGLLRGELRGNKVKKEVIIKQFIMLMIMTISEGGVNITNNSRRKYLLQVNRNLLYIKANSNNNYNI